MLGAIIGDIVGSRYEWNNIKTKTFPLFGKDCRFTDDTVMTIAVAEAVMNGGERDDFIDAMKKYSGVYFGAIGGAGALLAKCIKECELIAYEDLGAEALRKLYVEDMPLVVIIDSEGNNLYEEGRAAYLAQRKEG